jgi:hypothetical protein
MKAKSQYATYSIRCSDLPDDEGTVKIHIKSFDTGSAEEWLDFLQSFLSRMKGWQQGAGVGPTIFRNLRILLQGTALSRFDAHATNIVAQTSAHAFVCLDAMTAEFFMLRPDKAGPVVFSAPPVKFYTVAFHWRRTSIRRKQPGFFIRQ